MSKRTVERNLRFAYLLSMWLNRQAFPTLLVQTNPPASTVEIYSPENLRTEITRIYVAEQTGSGGNVSVLFQYRDEGGSLAGGDYTFYRTACPEGGSILLDGNSSSFGLVMAPGSAFGVTMGSADTTVSVWGITENIAKGEPFSRPVAEQLFQGTIENTLTTVFTNPELRTEITRIWFHNDSNSTPEDFRLYYVESGGSATADNLIYRAEVATNNAIQLDGHAESLGLVMAPGSILAADTDLDENVLTIFGYSESIALR